MVWMARLCLALSAAGVVAITPEERTVCHMGRWNETGRLCHAYSMPRPKEHVEGMPIEDHFGVLAPECMSVTWWAANPGNNWGNCVNNTEGIDVNDGQMYRYTTTNSVPPYYFNPYCPLGLKARCANNTNDTESELCGGYCIKGEPCAFTHLACGITNSTGFTPYGDVWTPMVQYTKVPKHPNPTRQDRPGDMYEGVGQGGTTAKAAAGVHLNGNSIQGPNDHGNVNVDEAGFQLVCGGHVTPPISPPMYHYHKAPDCTPEFLNHSVPISKGGKPHRHGTLYGYMMDGFGVYTFTDVGGAAAVLDECGGHFGPVDDDHPEAVEYHYHATIESPYHNACQGPALGRCEEVQYGVHFCGKGCGAEVCAQPGTKKAHLQSYLSRWNSTWLDSYTTNLDSFPTSGHTLII